MKAVAILAVLCTIFFATSSALILPQRGLFSLLKAKITDVFSIESGLEDFWEEAKQFGPKAGQVVLNEIARVHTETAQIVGSLKSATSDVVEEAQRMRAELQVVIEQKNFTIGHLSDVLSDEIGKAYMELTQDRDVIPLPKQPSERDRARAELINKVMQKVKIAYVRAMVEFGVPEEQAEQQFERVSPKIAHLVLVTGDFIDKHPMLLELVIFSASMLLLPEIQILRPIMAIFGFGPLGPVKGSTAAWLQSRFWGGFVKSGSWFAILQKVGMTLTGSWIQKIIASAGLAAALGLVTNKAMRACS